LTKTTDTNKTNKVIASKMTYDMKHSILTTTIALALASSSYGLTVSPSASILDAGRITFQYNGHNGVISPDSGLAYGLGISTSLTDKLDLGAEVQYLDIGLKSVTVGGQPKNWGSSAQGYYVGAKASYWLARIGGVDIRGTAGFGYQEVLGGAIAYSYGLEAKKNAVSLTVERRHIGDTTYDGLRMRSEPSTFIGFKLNKSF